MFLGVWTQRLHGHKEVDSAVWSPTPSPQPHCTIDCTGGSPPLWIILGQPFKACRPACTLPHLAPHRPTPLQRQQQAFRSQQGFPVNSSNSPLSKYARMEQSVFLTKKKQRNTSDVMWRPSSWFLCRVDQCYAPLSGRSMADCHGQGSGARGSQAPGQTRSRSAPPCSLFSSPHYFDDNIMNTTRTLFLAQSSGRSVA